MVRRRFELFRLSLHSDFREGLLRWSVGERVVTNTKYPANIESPNEYGLLDWELACYGAIYFLCRLITDD
jgi:hypothetical protein